jgi:hypothetical protein
MVWSRSQSTAGRSQPGQRQVKSRQRTKSANAFDGTYPGSGAASPGWTSGTSLADVASSATSSAGMRPSAPIIEPGACPPPVMVACSAIT